MPSSDIAIRALDYAGRPFVSAPDRAQCFDCISFLNALTGVDIPVQWMDIGGPLPFTAIALGNARPGDIIAFTMPWPHQPHHAAIMVAGEGVDDRHAKITGPYLCHAAVTSWLAPYWRQYAVSAWRLPIC